MLNSLYQILNERFNVPEEDLKEAQRIHTEKGTDFAEILVAKKMISERQLLEALSIQYDIPFWPELPIEKYQSDFTNQVPIHFLKKYIMIPLVIKTQTSDQEKDLHDGNWQNSEKDFLQYGSVIAVNDPSCIQPMDDLIRMLGYDDVRPVLSTKDAILFAINMSYDLSRGSAEQLVQDMEENGSTIISELEEKADLLDDISDAPIIKLVNHIISQSVKARASDIFLE